MKKVKIDSLQLWDKNPRTIKDKRFKALCKSLTDDPSFMELRPILATKEGRIYAGNMRYRAAKELGWTEIPAILTDIDDKLANERAIKDNNEFGEWNNDELSTLLDEMEKNGTDISTLGLDESIEKIIEQLNEKEIVEDEVPEPKKDPQTKLGDLWILGEHRLLCGDATKIDDVERLMDGEKADMVFTDPPYNLGYEYNSYKDDKTYDEYKTFCTEWFNTLNTQSPRGIIITPGKQNLAMWFSIAQPHDIGIWLKMNGMSGGKISNLNLWEPILFYGAFDRSSRATDVFDYNVKQQKDVGGHTCPKILEMIAEIVSKYSKDSVLDVFGGSGTTLIACEQLKRKCYMMEIDPQYVRVIIDRWEKLTGEKAKLA